MTQDVDTRTQRVVKTDVGPILLVFCFRWKKNTVAQLETVQVWQVRSVKIRRLFFSGGPLCLAVPLHTQAIIKIILKKKNTKKNN